MFYRLWNRRRREPELEPPPVGNRDRQFRGLFAGVPLIIGLVIISVLGLLLVFHTRFMAQVNECRITSMASADLQLIAEEAPYFLQPMGSLTMKFSSDDSPEAVDNALRRIVALAQREGVLTGDFRNVPTMTWEVEAAEGGGSHIILHCP